MSGYSGVTGQGVPPVPYITHGSQLAAELERLAGAAAGIGDLSPVLLRVVLDVSVLDARGTSAERCQAIDGLSHTLAGLAACDLDADGVGGVLRQTLPAPRGAGRVEVVVYGRVDAASKGGRS